MANWSNPLLTSTYTNFLTEVKDRDTDLALQFDGTTSTNIPTGAIRWNSSVNRWQKWSGSAWGELTSTYALTGLSTTGNATIGGTLGSGAFTSSSTVTGTALLPTGNTVPANGIYLPSANTLGIATATTCRVLVDSSGNVGIGTLSPSTGLHLAVAAASAGAGNLLVAPPSAGQARYRLYNQGAQAEWIFGQKTGTDHDFKLSKSVAGSESDYFTITTTGSVGIGTNSPAVKLHVAGQIIGTSTAYALRATNGSGTDQTSIGLERVGASTDQKYWELLQSGDGAFVLRTVNDAYSASQNAITIGRGSSYNVDNVQLLTMGSARLHINSSGNIGIGTTAPSVLLHVNGPARIGANNADDAELQIGAGATGNRNAYIDLVGDTTYADYGLRLIRGNGGANTTSTLAHRGTGTLYINCEENADLAFQTNNTLRAYFSGTTFKLTNGTDIRTNVNTGSINIFGGDGTGANIELFGGSHASLASLMVLDAGEHRIRSQDGATDWMRVTSTGRVGIGVTAPAAGFHVGSTAASASIGNIYIAPTTAGQARYHLFNGGVQAEWLFGQKTSTDHDFKLSKQVAGSETDYLVVTTTGLLKFDSGYGSAATAYGCRAWVNFDGTGTTGANQTIRASGNVASVYKNGTGDYTVTFTTAMPDANYAVNATLEQAGRDNWISISDLTTTTFKVYSKDNTLGLEDSSRICITVVR
jgi:hypothetical protein